ncbi:hypothetical protein F0562_016257 [Nyssa sinensis]|uniref:Glycosyltransferase n=1 Tax=Nyssa sinensis TaxID=561372 RepID=A0A5J4ZM06_9ASTE|nr:hypothetical protein F0562_016257 [Nyssa sinensis]
MAELGMDVPQPHVVILPFPAQGHIKPMLMLAELLCHAGFDITFVNTDHNHTHIDQSGFHSRFPRLRFMSIPDGLPPEHPRIFSGRLAPDWLFSTRSVSKPKFKDLVISLSQETGRWSPPTCIIADGIMSSAIDVAEELEIPVITFRTYNAGSTWINFHITKLIEKGEIPFQGDDMNRPITSIPELENILRRKDLPSICRVEEVENPVLQFYITETAAMTRASALILNTFNELEAPVISQLGSIFPKIYTIGPLHALLESRIKDHPRSDSSNGSLRKQDRTCLTWLDSQPSKSVIYVSFGSVVVLTHDQLLEFWHGLVNSEKPFLWVRRQGLLGMDEEVGETPAELMRGTEERGCIVGWAPQEEVLAHRAVGGFLTHGGWNSTLESILAGVPMVCWPQVADQQPNSRFVSDLWGIGLDMKDTCDRSIVEKMVRDLMEGKRESIRQSSAEISRMAHDSVQEGGSSYCNIDKLIEHTRSIM